MKKSDIEFYVQLLGSDECGNPDCNSWKKRKQVFCYQCYRKLPKIMQDALWSKLGQGFEEAVDEAFEYLKDI